VRLNEIIPIRSGLSHFLALVLDMNITYLVDFVNNLTVVIEVYKRTKMSVDEYIYDMTINLVFSILSS
jgi:hypothetical protein